nr:hypothetical protein [Tanacetum cinerariifolium]
MVRNVSNDEVKSVIFSMRDDRDPGPNGFTAAFFKKAWDVVGGDITCGCSGFFLQWVKEGLGDIVSINQSAFVLGRRISDNILLTQELMRNYHRRRGPPSSVVVIMDALEEFKYVSGLVPSIPKSTTFFCNVPNAIKAYIVNSMPFAEGVLPVRMEDQNPQTPKKQKKLLASSLEQHE